MKKGIFIALFLLVGFSASGQIGLQKEQVRQAAKVPSFKVLLSNTFFIPQLPIFSDHQERPSYPLLHTLTQNAQTPKWYQTKDLAFFCRIEVELEKSVRMPVKFRLGNVPYVDYLEGKTRSY